MSAPATTAAPAIVPYRPEHRASLMALWRRYFGEWSEERLHERWRWQFEENPCRAEREPVILVAQSGDEVVGHISGVPVPLLLNGRRSVALVTSGMVVDERHRWVAVRLISALFKAPPYFGRVQHPSVCRLYEHHGAPVLGASRTRFVCPRRYRGWLAQALRRRLPGALDRIVAPRTVALMGAVWHPGKRPPARRMRRRPAGSAAADIRRISNFDAEYDRLWARCRGRWSCSVDKDSRYMNWRYIQCPTLHAVSMGLYGEGGALKAVAVGVRWAQTDRSQNPCGSNGEIAEVIAETPDDPQVQVLVLRVMKWLDRRKVDELGAGSLHPSLHPLLGRLGFTRETADTFQVSLAGGDPAMPTSDEAWYYTASDSDALYSPGL